jgi:hypothetical protein
MRVYDLGKNTEKETVSMARPESYDPEQWESMNKPEGQVRIQVLMTRYIRSFLDTAPEGDELVRVQEVIWILRRYFERELELAEATFDHERNQKAEIALIHLCSSLRGIASLEKRLANAPPAPLLSPEELEKKIAEWERFEGSLHKEGKRHWWE